MAQRRLLELMRTPVQVHTPSGHAGRVSGDRALLTGTTFRFLEFSRYAKKAEAAYMYALTTAAFVAFTVILCSRFTARAA